MSRRNVDADTELLILQLAAQGVSERQISRQLGVPRSTVKRRIAAAREAEAAALEAELAADEDDDEDELMERLRGMDVAEPSAVLMPPFDFDGLDDGALRLRDAHGCIFGELDLWRWSQWIHGIVPADFPDRETYLKAWDAAEVAIEDATAAAWASVRRHGVVFDDVRRRWVQRPRAV